MGGKWGAIGPGLGEGDRKRVVHSDVSRSRAALRLANERGCFEMEPPCFASGTPCLVIPARRLSNGTPCLASGMRCLDISMRLLDIPNFCFASGKLSFKEYRCLNVEADVFNIEAKLWDIEAGVFNIEEKI